MLTKLAFEFLHMQEEREITGTDDAFDMGLGYLSSLQDVTVDFHYQFYSKEEVDEATAMLREATGIHPNNPTFRIINLRGKIIAPVVLSCFSLCFLPRFF